MKEKLVITLDSSQIRAYMTCPHYWYLSYRDNLRYWSDGLKVNYADPGSLMHKILEIFYTLRALNPNEPRLNHMNLAIEVFKKNNLYAAYKVPETQDFYLTRFTQYCINYATNDINPLYANNRAGVEIGFTKKLYEDDHVIYLVEGKIDLIGSYSGMQVFADNKTQIRVGNLYDYKPQFLTYAWATGIERGVYNYIGLQKECKPEENLRRKLVYIPEWMIERWKISMMNVFNEIAMQMQVANITTHSPQYLGEEESFTIFNGYDLNSNLNSESFERNLNACSGPDEKRTCIFALICNQESVEKRLAIRQHYFKTVEAWKPW